MHFNIDIFNISITKKKPNFFMTTAWSEIFFSKWDCYGQCTPTFVLVNLIKLYHQKWELPWLKCHHTFFTFINVKSYSMKTQSWKIPPKYHLPRFGLIFKSGNSPLENQYFSTFQIQLEPRCQRWKILIFTRGTPTFSNENQKEANAIFGVFPKILFFM